MAQRLAAGGVAALGVGMILVVMGVVTGPLFVPGVVAVGLGLVLVAASGVAGLAGDDARSARA